MAFRRLSASCIPLAEVELVTSILALTNLTRIDSSNVILWSGNLWLVKHVHTSMMFKLAELISDRRATLAILCMTTRNSRQLDSQCLHARETVLKNHLRSSLQVTCCSSASSSSDKKLPRICRLGSSMSTLLIFLARATWTMAITAIELDRWRPKQKGRSHQHEVTWQPCDRSRYALTTIPKFAASSERYRRRGADVSRSSKSQSGTFSVHDVTCSTRRGTSGAPLLMSLVICCATIGFSHKFSQPLT
ncbi:uncharacterized protein F5Z01DRAFT_269064 [Emericellopsis atlantica]|uniref:Uncharacterized protein n=1 Tax=Emericellopsis atlantica TaxID=2614577 RepID=A0A9P7ZH23_9HYPO|nr:uncharacterized protein F5Z01DRAFT_269064 [Emericellopsis atlantica]KAG9251537.1 hypothetical protein F5Z01DRAFT_269064 [Emericellopsis atlantica]